ncbi:PDGLE domain-containing protein [Nocardioides baculatus]|uniref:PDGLE domain-containing protein n=1 Tax=Nocardioides baculatus TaxID=2801337 RepID=A0ABS1L9L3_9ACTN|nr:PDGLE domain-containing protein [Nocardioides baculatus]MBL0748379.1 PDGLE domain-containing protein [Nocardioides baculatus]
MNTRRRVSTRTVLVVGLLVALVLAGVVSYYASASPDGLNRVAGDLGFAGAEQASRTQDGPLAGYETAGVDGRWSGGLAGVIGCLVVLALTTGLMLVRRRSAQPTTVGGE